MLSICVGIVVLCVCVCVYMKGSNSVSWGPTGSSVQILGPEHLARGLVRRRPERDVGGLPLPLSHQAWTVGGRWTGHTNCQRARGATGATGEGQPRLSEPTQRNKTDVGKKRKMQKQKKQKKKTDFSSAAVIRQLLPIF